MQEAGRLSPRSTISKSQCASLCLVTMETNGHRSWVGVRAPGRRGGVRTGLPHRRGVARSSSQRVEAGRISALIRPFSVTLPLGEHGGLSKTVLSQLMPRFSLITQSWVLSLSGFCFNSNFIAAMTVGGRRFLTSDYEVSSKYGAVQCVVYIHR